jgi:uncharacterized membrane protein
MICFRDNVFSILMTILILEIKASWKVFSDKMKSLHSPSFALMSPPPVHVRHNVFECQRLAATSLQTKRDDDAYSSFVNLLYDNLAILVGFVANFVLSATLWGIHQHIFLHIRELSSGWRKFHQLVLSLACFTPFTCILVSGALLNGNKDRNNEDFTLIMLFVRENGGEHLRLTFSSSARL